MRKTLALAVFESSSFIGVATDENVFKIHDYMKAKTNHGMFLENHNNCIIINLRKF